MHGTHTISPSSRPGAKYRLEAEIWVPQPREAVFAFFSDAYNLEAMTPPWMNFHVATPAPIVMSEGTLIDYRLRLHGIPLSWRSVISLWEPPYRFVDEQVRGPYRMWHHEHQFEEQNGGTLVRDLVDYAVPGGAFIHWLLVRRDIDRIFAYRTAHLQQRFGQPTVAKL